MTIDSVRRQLREQLRERVDARGLATAPRTERRLRVREEALALLRASGAILPQRELTRMVNEVSDEVVGFGPIEFLLKDPDVTEVMVNGPDDVYVEREGRIERAPDGLFEGEEAVLHLIERIVGPLGSSGRRIIALGGCATSGGQPGPRDHPASLAPRSRAHDPQVLAGAHHGRGSGRERDASGRACLRFLEACVRGRANMVVSRRRGHREDDDARGPVGVHPRRRAADHDRGRRRAAAGEAARRLARGAARERRGTRRGHRPRPRPQRPAHATRTGSSSARSAAARRSTCSRR